MSIDSGSTPSFPDGGECRQWRQGRGGTPGLTALRGSASFALLATLISLGIHLVPGMLKPEEGRAGSTLIGYEGPIKSLTFDPAGMTLASVGRDQKVKIWDVTAGAAISGRPLGEELCLCLAYSPDGKTMATAGLGGITLWDTSRGYERAGGWVSGPIHAMRFSPDGRTLLTNDGNGGVHLWDMARRIVLSDFDIRLGGTVTLSPSTEEIRWASITGDLRARVWKGTPGERELTPSLVAGGDYFAIAFSPDGRRLFAGSRRGSIQCWDVAPGRAGDRFDPGGWITALAVSPDGRRLAFGKDDGTVAILDLATRRIQHSWREHSSSISALAFAPDGGRLASGGQDSIIKIWDVSETPAEPQRLALAGD